MEIMYLNTLACGTQHVARVPYMAFVTVKMARKYTYLLE
jgi:hypothetical protein